MAETASRSKISLKSMKNVREIYELAAYLFVFENYDLCYDVCCILDGVSFTGDYTLIRLQLREDLGGLIYVPYRLKLFIGYDYMMGVHASINLRNLYTFISDLGLNIYEF